MAFLARKFKDIYFPYRIFTVFSISFLLGILIASFIKLDFARSWQVFIYIFTGLLAVGIFNYLLKIKVLALLSFSFLFAFFGASYYSYFEFKNQKEAPFGEKLEVSGKISQRPEMEPKYQKIILDIKVSSNDSKGITDAKIIVRAPLFPEYHYGEMLNITGSIEEPQNFSSFDYKNYLLRQGIVGEIKAPVEIKFMGKSAGLPDRFYSTLFSIPVIFEHSLNKTLPEPHSSLASGILLGVKRNIPDSLLADLQKTGLVHIIALSGFNVTIIIALLTQLLIPHLGRRRTFILGMIFVILFVVMTGASPSIVRAAIFSFLILYGKTVGRTADQTNLLLLTALLMTLFNPYALAYDLGFQLSFLAFSGLIYLSPLIERILQKPRLRLVPTVARSPLAQTLSAQFAVTPLIFFKFSLISLISPLANLLVVWIVPWIMIITFFTGLLSIIYLPLGKITIVLLWPGLEYIIKVVELCSNLPFSSLNF